MAILKSFVLLFSPISGELQPDIGLFTSDANTGKNWCEYFDVKTPNNFTGVGKIS